MSSVQHRAPHRAQPVNRRLDPKHWIWKLVRQGIIAAPLRDATLFNRITSAPGVVHEGLGLAQPLKLLGPSAYVTSPTVTNSSGWTMLAFGVLRSTGALSAIATVAEAPGNATGDRSLYITSANAVSGSLYDGTATKTSTTTGTVAAGVPLLVAATATGSSINAYLRGELVTTAAANAGYAAYASPELVHGYGQNGTTAASQWSAFYTLLLTRALTLGELLEIDRDPWSIFEPVDVAVAAAAVSGGASLIDAAAGADLLNATVVFNVSLIDSAAGADVLSASAIRNATLVDSAAGADALSALTTLAASLVDASSGADVLSASGVRNATLLDAAAGADQLSAGFTVSATLVDGASVDDVRSALSILAASLTDGATVADVLSASMVANVTATEAAAGADLLNAGNTANRSLVDGAAGADALSAAAIMVASLVDSASVTDQLNAAQQLVVLLTDAAAGSDVRSGSIPVTYNVSLVDLAAALDVLHGVIAGGFALPLLRVYTVLAENRTFAVLAEDRTYVVPNESRDSSV